MLPRSPGCAVVPRWGLEMTNHLKARNTPKGPKYRQKVDGVGITSRVLSADTYIYIVKGEM